MKFYTDIENIIGNTPLLKLCNINNSSANIFVKLENKNPLNSVKDRIGYAMITAAEQAGLLKPSSIIIEPTSGNTGIALAYIASKRGYRCLLTMPETMSIERQKLLKALGAELFLTDGKLGMNGAIEKAQALNSEINNSIILGQFTNPANPRMHFETTGPEIWNDLAGNIEAFVSVIGTGGTFTGVSEFLKSQNPNVKTIAVEPAKSAVLSGKTAAPHKIQGIGAGFIPKILKTELIDEIITIDDEAAYETTNLLAKKEGVFCGISSGANVWAALQLAKRAEYSGKNICTIICDTGERYLSTELFA